MTKRKIGLAIFAIINISLVLTLLSPYISNPIVRWRNDAVLATVDENITKHRTGIVNITVVNNLGEPIQGASIHANMTEHDFKFGALWQYGSLTGNIEDDYETCKLFLKLFNTATIPVWWAYWEPNVYTNRSIALCEKYGIHLRGQCVYWPYWESEPNWLNNIEDKNNLTDTLHDRMLNTVGRFKNNISEWEVFNEFFHWIGNSYYGLNRLEFMKNATNWAREINPDIKIIANDFFTTGHGGSAGDLYWFYKDIAQKGVDYDCIGMQAHQFQTDWYPAADLYESFDAFSNFGKTIQITEFMATSRGVPITNSYKKGTWSEERQAEFTEEFYRVAFSHPAVESICYWTTFENNAGQGIFRRDKTPKPAYYTLDNLINNEWRTEKTISTNEEGSALFRGYYGTYNVTVDGGQTFEIKTNATSSNEFLLQIP